MSNFIEHPTSGKTGSFATKFSQHAERNGQTFTVLGAVDPTTYDAEGWGEMFSIRFADGVQIDAWPEEVQSAMKAKNFTIGDGYAVMILAGERMGLGPAHVEEAKHQLAGHEIHPMTGSAMEKTAIDINERMRHDAALIAKANIHAEHIKAEYGIIVDISQEAFLALQCEAEQLEIAHAKGQDLPEHASRLKVIDKIMNAQSWTLHPDYGCILKSEVNARDRAA